MRTALLVLPCTLLALTACGGGDNAPVAAGGPVTVKASDDACDVGRTELSAGKNVFTITNTGSKVTEVYVYGPDDKVVAEKENIGPGLRFDVSATLTPGTYDIACKPGQTGDGIRTPITVTAS